MFCFSLTGRVQADKIDRFCLFVSVCWMNVNDDDMDEMDEQISLLDIL